MNQKTLRWLLVVLLVVVILVIGLLFFAGKSFSRQTGQPTNFRGTGRVDPFVSQEQKSAHVERENPFTVTSGNCHFDNPSAGAWRTTNPCTRVAVTMCASCVASGGMSWGRISAPTTPSRSSWANP